LGRAAASGVKRLSDSDHEANILKLRASIGKRMMSDVPLASSFPAVSIHRPTWQHV
jgi:hypothetical protein